MKKKILIYIAPLLIMACSKENTVNNNTVNKKGTKEMLMANNWIIAINNMLPGIIIGSDTITDIFAETAPCDKDDFLKFEENDSLIFDEGEIFCSKNDVQVSKGIYLIKDNEHFTTIFQKDTINYTILELNENALLVSYQDFIFNQKQLCTIKYIKK